MLHVVFIQPNFHITPSQLYNALKTMRLFCSSLLVHAAPADESAPVPLVFPRVFLMLLLLPLVILRSQVVSYGRNKRMQLSEKGDSPHDIH